MRAGVAEASDAQFMLVVYGLRIDGGQWEYLIVFGSLSVAMQKAQLNSIIVI